MIGRMRMLNFQIRNPPKSTSSVANMSIKDLAPNFALSLFLFEVLTVAHSKPAVSAAIFICTNSLVERSRSPIIDASER